MADPLTILAVSSVIGASGTAYGVSRQRHEQKKQEARARKAEEVASETEKAEHIRKRQSTAALGTAFAAGRPGAAGDGGRYSVFS